MRRVLIAQLPQLIVKYFTDVVSILNGTEKSLDIIAPVLAVSRDQLGRPGYQTGNEDGSRLAHAS